ncbi:hypothetical protein SAMN05216584_104195 [Selenomonas sp. WCT3]|uniref:hypothetical protein n=1 Tax=Selenomonas sp. WCT3 TaxID=3158785 RepID=UPI00088E3779|nr:hypothetical protein SAMN05216584_104195 [Selenomonas ruminantium]
MVNTLGSLIIVGFILVMGARWLSRRQQGSWDEEELVDSANQLKAEIERSADAVIKRMGSHISHLEQLLQQAEARNRELEAQLSEARQLSLSLEQQGRQLDDRIMAAKQMAQELPVRWQNPPVMPMMAPAPMAPAAMAQQPSMMQPPAAAVERVDAQDFAAVLQKSIQREEQELHAPHVMGEHQAVGLAEAMNHRVTEAEEEPVKTEDVSDVEEPEEGMSQNAAKARALLLSGYSVEETARETGIGKGAIELLREMNRRELE